MTPAGLAPRIRDGDAGAEAELYDYFRKRARLYLLSLLKHPADIEDAFHEAFVDVLGMVRSDAAYNPEGLMRIVIRRKAIQLIHGRRHCPLQAARRRADPRPGPGELAEAAEERRIAGRVLITMLPRDREVLVRSYLHEQEPDRVMTEMRMSPTQYRLTKSRAKARFGEMGRAMLEAA